MVTAIRRWWYVRAMMRAVDEARSPNLGGGPQSKTNGLRAIKRFEDVNGVPFDPHCPHHVSRVSGCADRESFFRASKRLFKLLR